MLVSVLTHISVLLFFICGFYMYTFICTYIRTTSVRLLVYNCTIFLFICFHVYVWIRIYGASVSVMPVLDECMYMYIMHDRLYMYLCWPESPVLNLCSSYLLFGIVSQPLSGHSSTEAVLAQQPDRRKGRISPLIGALPSRWLSKYWEDWKDWPVKRKALVLT